MKPEGAGGIVQVLVISGGIFSILYLLVTWVIPIEVVVAFQNSVFANLSLSIAIAGALGSLLVGTTLYLAMVSLPRVHLLTDSKTRELLVAHEWFRKLYDEGPLPYLLIAPDGRIQQPNRAALRLFGAAPEAFIGQDFFSLVDKESKDVAREIQEYFRRHIPVDGKEVLVRRTDGLPRWVLLSLFISDGAPGSVRNGLVAMVDITEQKEIDRAKTEFVSLASHQLRTPPSIVRWYSEMLLGGYAGKLAEKQRHYVERIYSTNLSMIDLVRALLNVSRIELDTIKVEKGTTDLVAVTNDVLDELEKEIGEKRIRVFRQFDANLPMIETDKKLLRIVLNNLLGNAVKYTPAEGDVRVELGARGANSLSIIVTDTGMGIPEDEQEKIFTKMFRASNVARADAKGSGLGLYMSKSFVELLGGTISFTSALNKGTTFTVTLPR